MVEGLTFFSTVQGTDADPGSTTETPAKSKFFNRRPARTTVLRRDAADPQSTQKIPVTLAERSHPFPSRTRKLSSPAPKILGGQLPGKIGRRRDIHFPSRTPDRTNLRGSCFSGGYAGSVDRICPFLALEADRRSAMAGYDPQHRCLAREDPPPLDPATQRARCLTDDPRTREVYGQYS